MTIPLGNVYGISFTCVKVLEGLGTDAERVCGKPATLHIIWDETVENSTSCDGHARDADKFGALQVHTLGGACPMPGAIWLRDEHRCVVEGFPDIAAERRAVVELEPESA